ncbi:S-phase kinase-associated protein 2 [Amyelois transitella]|uniref:S-phase kinase-associated protein 2 n=1 Tax=Amyelois transitella TaxID=680683 RepID=UPI0029907AE8|nr:S-phase kinase-associated protein 2 [Amyelois transitella]
MSVDNSKEDIPPSRAAEEMGSPRKRIRRENSSRKSWSLMDRRTDREVLQEMGVGLLEPDENDQPCDLSPTSMHHKTLKRKHDIENMNPNVNCVTSPRSRFSPKSPKSRVKCSPSPGPSKAKSPRSLEKAALQQTELETSLVEGYLVDEETPLAQCVGRYSGGRGGEPRQAVSLGVEEEQIISRLSQSAPDGVDSFAALSDEMMLSVFRWLPKLTLSNCMLVCKRWYRVACDETLWQRLDLGNKSLARNALERILARKPSVIRLANSEIGEWHPTTPPIASRIQFLDLSMSTVDRHTLSCLLERCPALRRLSLENVALGDTQCLLVGKCKNLETLNLAMCQGITADGLKAILEGCQLLQSLNISWSGLSESALEVLVTSLPPHVTRLNVGGARIMTSDMLSKLVERCPHLLELDLSDCSQLGVEAVQSVQKLSRLEHLALSRCYLLPPHALTKVSSMPCLQFLDVWGMLPSKSLSALKAALPAIQINQFMFSAIARPTVGAKRTSIWGLRTRD